MSRPAKLEPACSCTAKTHRALVRSARRFGAEVAKERDRRLLEVFGADTFQAELARRAVLLRLRRANPRIGYARLDAAVEEALLP